MPEQPVLSILSTLLAIIGKQMRIGCECESLNGLFQMEFN